MVIFIRHTLQIYGVQDIGDFEEAGEPSDEEAAAFEKWNGKWKFHNEFMAQKEVQKLIAVGQYSAITGRQTVTRAEKKALLMFLKYALTLPPRPYVVMSDNKGVVDGWPVWPLLISVEGGRGRPPGSRLLGSPWSSYCMA